MSPVAGRIGPAVLAITVTLAACSSDDSDVFDAGDTSIEDDGALDVLDAGDNSELVDVADAPDDVAEAGDLERETTPSALVAEAGASFYAWVGDDVVLDGSASSGGLTYEWDPGDRSGSLGVNASPIATIRYEAPGRYRAVLTVRGADGLRRTDGVTVSVTNRPSHIPRHSSTIVRAGDGDTFYVVSADSNELVRIDRSGDLFARSEAWDTCARPRTVAEHDGSVAVACQDDDTVRIFGADGSFDDVVLDWGARPFGVVSDGDGRWHVSLQGTGEVATISLLDAQWQIESRWPAIHDARGLAMLPDQRVVVTRWRSPDDAAYAVAVDTTSGDTTPWELAFSDRLASDTEHGGVPSYLGQVVVSPQGDRAVFPTTLSNIGQGLWLNGEPLTFETTVRGLITWVDLATQTEDFDARKQFDDRGMSVAAAFSSRGDWLYVLDRGARSVETIDVLTTAQSASIIDVGYAPEGLVLSADDRYLLVDATLSREVRVYDVTSLSTLPVVLAVIGVPTAEPLPAELLRGKLLFNDALDERLAEDHYIACAHCHLDGEADHRTWDFTDRGEGLRNTISLLGRGGAAHGPIHWSANFDEIHDFEHDIRGPFGGSGLMSDDDFFAEGRDTTLGTSKAGISADLDALAAYVSSLTSFPRSPYRNADSSLTDAAVRGRAVFFDDATACATCHAPPRFTDSVFLTPTQPLLHDVGTITDASGQRLGAALQGIDTPTLLELWNSAPYLHDGSAATVREVLTSRNAGDTHGNTSGLTSDQIDDLTAFLLSLQGSTDELP